MGGLVILILLNALVLKPVGNQGGEEQFASFQGQIIQEVLP